jgi:hypothetical protein
MKTTFAVFAAVLAVAPQLASGQRTDCLPLPVLAVSRQGPTQLRLEVAGEPGLNYAIEGSDDLARWTRVATNRSDSGLVTFSYPFSQAAP